LPDYLPPNELFEAEFSTFFVGRRVAKVSKGRIPPPFLIIPNKFNTGMMNKKA